MKLNRINAISMVFALALTALVSCSSVAFAQDADSERFMDELELVMPQSGEDVTLSVPQWKQAIVAILSPRAGESQAEHELRIQEFKREYQSAPKMYTTQVEVVSRWYQKQFGSDSVTAIPEASDVKFTREQIVRLEDKSQVFVPGEWKQFRRFRDEPIGPEIPNDPNIALKELFKYRDSLRRQILRTNYAPTMKVEWLEKLDGCFAGKTGEESGWCKFERILDWSSLWEYTSGATSIAEKVEFIPDPEFKDTLALTMFLNRSGKDVGHALACGGNPIVPFTETKFGTSREIPREPQKPSQGSCVVKPAPGTKVNELGEIVLTPGETARVVAEIVGIDQNSETVKTMFSVNGMPKEGNTQSYVINPAIFDYRTGRYQGEFSYTDQFGQTQSCPFTFVIRAAAPTPSIPLVVQAPPPEAVCRSIQKVDSKGRLQTKWNRIIKPSGIGHYVPQLPDGLNLDYSTAKWTIEDSMLNPRFAPIVVSNYVGATVNWSQVLPSEKGRPYIGMYKLVFHAQDEFGRPIDCFIPFEVKKGRKWWPYALIGAGAGAGILAAVLGGGSNTPVVGVKPDTGIGGNNPGQSAGQ